MRLAERMLALLLFCWLWAGMSAVLAQEPQKVKETIREILSDRRYQKDISAQPQHLGQPKDYKSRGRWFDFGKNRSSSSSGMLQFVVYLLGALCIAAFLAMLIVRWINRPKPQSAAGTTVSGSRSALAQSPETEQGHQELFATGNIVDACRKILHDGLHLLRDKKLIPIGKSLTNREIVARLAEQELQQPVQQIAMVVERGYYAQLPVSEKDYETCLHHLENIQRLAK